MRHDCFTVVVAVIVIVTVVFVVFTLIIPYWETYFYGRRLFTEKMEEYAPSLGWKENT